MNRRDRIAELREAGMTQERISQIVGLSKGAVSWYCIIDGLEGGRQYKMPERTLYTRNNRTVRPFTPNEDKNLLELEAQGLNYSKIAKQLGRNRNSVWARLAALAKYEERKLS